MWLIYAKERSVKWSSEIVLIERVNDDQTRTKSQPTNLQQVYITVMVIIWHPANLFRKLEIKHWIYQFCSFPLISFSTFYEPWLNSVLTTLKEQSLISHFCPFSPILKVTSPYGESMHSAENVDSGSFAFVTKEAGDYLACFWTPEHKPAATISFEFEWKSGVTAKDWSNVAKKGQVEVNAISSSFTKIFGNRADSM